MSSSLARIPTHLRKYVVSQHYDRYTAEEQATWRFLLRQLRDFLGRAAHSCYLDGLKKTGISIDRIPKIDEMDELLQQFGWGAVPVSGFIPPAAFMEFQSLSILPIACDMRSLDHLLYTPAPDIVHEAAGHAPILIHPEYAEYLKNYAQVAKKAIISKEDLDQYEAIRMLSDLKEHPGSTQEEIEKANQTLEKINQNMSHVSEASLLSRMNWWTAEYGLVGDISNPKIYGAGLLSSLGESRDCLKDHVKKVPLDVSCVEVSYDITEPQPQLFVTPDFANLSVVLDHLSEKLSFKKGGLFGLEAAKQARSINTVELDSGLQISGILEDYRVKDNQVYFLKFSGPSQLSLNDQQLSGHGKDFHSHGYSSPIGTIKGVEKALHQLNQDDMKQLHLTQGQEVNLEFSSGISLKGTLVSSLLHKNKPLLLSFKNCSVKIEEEVLFDPAWGQFDLACGKEIPTVFGGPSDRLSFGEVEDFAAKRVPEKKFSEKQIELFSFYNEVAQSRTNKALSPQSLTSLWSRFKSTKNRTWLLGIEILEIACHLKEDAMETEIYSYLLSHFSEHKANIEDGARLARLLSENLTH